VRLHSQSKTASFLLVARAFLPALALTLGMVGCGGGSPQQPPPTLLAVSPSSAKVLLGNTQQFTCNVSCGNWSVNGTVAGSSTLGTISATGLYTAPPDLPSSTNVMVSATNQANAGQTSTASVTIQSDLAVSVASSPTGAVSVPEGGTVQFTAKITSAGAPDQSVTWAVNGVAGGNPTPGTISPGGLYTAPSTLPSPPTISITATSVADPTKSANDSLTIAGTIATTSQAITAAAGGTIALPDGSNVVIPPGALVSDQTVTLSEVTILPKQPPNASVVSVGNALILSLTTPNPTASKRKSKMDVTDQQGASTDLTFTITDPSSLTSSLQNSAPITDSTDISSVDNFIGAAGTYDGNIAQVSVPFTDLSGVSSQDAISTLSVSEANIVPSTPPALGSRSLTNGAWSNFSCPAAGANVLVLVHGMASSVEQAFPAAGGCAGTIQGNGGYNAVVGFNYDWQHQSIDDAGQQLATFLDQLSQCNGGVGQIDVEAHSEGVAVTISAGGLAKTANISNFVSLGGPILGTPVASNA
jgi:hypothetical protein